MTAERFAVGIIVERRPARNRWQRHVWRVTEILPGRPATPPWTVLDETGGITRLYAGTTDIVVYSRETEALVHNLEAANPAVWVVLRATDAAPGWQVHLATADAGEAHAHADTGDDLVELVPMPAAVRAWLEPFVARHHIERQHVKRKRDRADPEALAMRGRRGDGPHG